jgi:hypothetical protein
MITSFNQVDVGFIAHLIGGNPSKGAAITIPLRTSGSVTVRVIFYKEGSNNFTQSTPQMTTSDPASVKPFQTEITNFIYPVISITPYTPRVINDKYRVTNQNYRGLKRGTATTPVINDPLILLLKDRDIPRVVNSVTALQIALQKGLTLLRVPFKDANGYKAYYECSGHTIIHESYDDVPMSFRYSVNFATKTYDHFEAIKTYMYKRFRYSQNSVNNVLRLNPEFIFTNEPTPLSLYTPVTYTVEVQDVSREDGIYEAVFDFDIEAYVRLYEATEQERVLFNDISVNNTSPAYG